MRIFYVFNIRKEIYDLYSYTPSVIFNFLNRLYYSKKEDFNSGNIIYNQMIDKFNKEKLDLKIYIWLHNKLIYSKKGEEHIINNLYKDEISIMKIKKSYIVINTNKNISEFFNIINKEYKECFVCDFINQDYFFIQNIKKLV